MPEKAGVGAKAENHEDPSASKPAPGPVVGLDSMAVSSHVTDSSPGSSKPSGSPLPTSIAAVRPESREGYVSWARTHVPDDLDTRTRIAFDINATAAQNTAQEHPFFASLPYFIVEIESAYRKQTGYDLLVPRSTLELGRKSFDSFVEKAWRKNVIENALFPFAPTLGWITFANCTTTVNDIVRGTLVCRYLDGPEYLARQLKQRANALALESRYYSQQNERGYYAYHFYVKIPVKIIDLSLNASVSYVEIEIQLSTQLQEVLRDLTHRLYEELRVVEQSDDAWKWDFAQKRFKASYLGHTLHLIEGVIVELRTATHGKEKGK